MKTFIWADHDYPFSEYQFFVAQSDNVDEARLLIKNQLQYDLKAQIDNLQESTYEEGTKYDFVYWVKYVKEKYEQNISSIDKYEPSHIISGGMGICIEHSNY